MALEYKILTGKTDFNRVKSDETLFNEKLRNLEKQVNSALAIGGSTLGGIYIKDNRPYQAAMVPKASTNVEPTNPFTTAVRSATGGSSRKSRKNRK